MTTMLKSHLFQLRYGIKFLRNLTIAQHKENIDRIKAWQVHSYGEDLQCCSVRVPIITRPSEVLVKIEAASVNPIDILMKDGYGRTLLKILKCEELILPVTLGRDFSGTIIDKGHDVGSEFNIGDKVYGVIPFNKQGSHSELAVAEKDNVMCQPSTLSHTEAASIPFAALTVYSAIWYTGGLSWRKPKSARILVLGASGGVGTLAVQILRAMGATVIGTCSTDAVPLVQSLGADCVLDYKSSDYFQNVASQGKYDIILDCARMGHESMPPSWQYSQYISLNSPLLRHIDQYGLFAGLAFCAADIIPANIVGLSQGKSIKWAYFYPTKDGFQYIDKLIRTNQLTPVIDKVYGFDQIAEAYNKMKSGHSRGKIVVDMLEVNE